MGLRAWLVRWICLWAALLVACPAWAGEVLVDMLDIGQGDSILIRGGGKAVLIDAGIPESKVVDQLHALGVTRLDLVIATHPHADHIGDMIDVVRGFDIGLYMDNGLPHTTVTYQDLMKAVEERGIPYRAARLGQKIKLGEEATMEVLWPSDTPLRDTRSDLNSNSVVVWLTHGENTFLFTGDSEEPTEAALLANGIGPVDVLKVAHHGSEHSSVESFLAVVHPKIALISCGTGNRYGHPDPIALARYAAIGAHVYRTDTQGHLRVVSNGKTLTVQEGLLPEFRGLAARASASSRPGSSGGGSSGGHPAAAPVETYGSDKPTASAQEMGVDLSGVQASNPAFDDIGPNAPRKKKKKKGPAEAEVAP